MALIIPGSFYLFAFRWGMKKLLFNIILLCTGGLKDRFDCVHFDMI